MIIWSLFKDLIFKVKFAFSFDICCFYKFIFIESSHHNIKLKDNSIKLLNSQNVSPVNFDKLVNSGKFFKNKLLTNKLKNKVKFVKYDKILGDKFYVRSFRYNFAKQEGRDISPSISRKSECEIELNESGSELNTSCWKQKMPIKSSQNNFPIDKSVSLSRQWEDVCFKARSNLFKDNRKSKLSILQIETIIRNKELVPNFNF